MTSVVLLAGVLALALGWRWTASRRDLVLALAIAAFFRDPERSPDTPPPSAWCSRAPTAR